MRKPDYYVAYNRQGKIIAILTPAEYAKFLEHKTVPKKAAKRRLNQCKR